MIYATVNMTIGDYSSTCDNKILLYRGDKNVEIRIVMKGNKFTVLDSTYAQMIIKRPSATSVFSAPAPIQNDTVVFVITEDMIDELKEIGEYTFQVRLYDDTMTARATLPPCNSVLMIESPIALEENTEAAVNLAIVNDSAVMLADTTSVEEDIFTEDNKYNKTIWVAGDLITDVKLNKIEDALYTINDATNEVVQEVENEMIFETDELVINSLGGISAGTDLNGLSVKDILNKLLYPYIKPSVSVSTTPNGGLYEHGNYQTITNIKVVITKKTENIKLLRILDGDNVIYSKEDSIENGGTFNITCNVTINDSRRLTIEVTDAIGSIVTASTNVFNYIYPYYYGVANEDTLLDGDFIQTLTKKVEAKGTKSISYTTNNQRMIFAYPASYGEISKILDANSFDVTNTFTVTTITLTALDETTQSYYVYANEPSTVENFTMHFSY